MKVVEGTFGQQEGSEEERPTLLEAVTAAFEEIGCTDEREGMFFMCINTPDRYTFLTNEPNPAELIALLESSKLTIVQSYMENM